MKCYDVRRKLSAFLDGAEEASLRDAVARHVDTCVSCRAELEALTATDRVLAAGLGAAANVAAPSGYFEDFWPRLSARLDDEPREVDAMSMSRSGSPEDRSQVDRAPAPGNGDVKPERNEVSGLHDIRQLAASTIERHHKEHPDVGEVADALLTSASPAALGQVLLPTPGREVSQPVASVAARGVDPVVAQAARGSSGWGRTLVIASAVLIAGGAVAFVMMQKNKRNLVAGSEPAATDTAASDRGAAAPSNPMGATPTLVARLDETPASAGTTPSAPAETATPATPVEVRPGGKPADVEAKPRDPKEKEKRTEPAKPGVAPPAEAKPETKPEEKPATEAPKEPATAAKKDPAIEDLFKPVEDDKPADKPIEEKPAIPTELSDAEVKKGMRTVLARVGDCYSKYKITGTVKVKTTIEPDGTVSKAIAVDDKFANTETGYCVADAVGVARFTPWSGSARTVTYPFALK